MLLGFASKARERGSFEGGAMCSRREILEMLREECHFLEQGGYRSSTWRPPLIFEDSPTCLKPGQGSCVDAGCRLLQFVPAEHLGHAAPCRHIPLNDSHETIDSLYRTGTAAELEQALRLWLLRQIKQLEGEQTYRYQCNVCNGTGRDASGRVCEQCAGTGELEVAEPSPESGPSTDEGSK